MLLRLLRPTELRCNKYEVKDLSDPSDMRCYGGQVCTDKSEHLTSVLSTGQWFVLPQSEINRVMSYSIYSNRIEMLI